MFPFSSSDNGENSLSRNAIVQGKLRISCTLQSEFSYFNDLFISKLAMVPFPSISRNNVFGVNVIFSLCNPLKIFRNIMGFIKILMVNLMVWCGWLPNKSERYKSMNKPGFMLGISTEADLSISSDISSAKDSAFAMKAFDAPFIRNCIKTFITDYISPFFHRNLLLRMAKYNLLIVDMQPEKA